MDEPRQLGLFGGDGRGPADAAPPLRLAEAVDAYLTVLASIGRSLHTLRAARVDLGGLVRRLDDPPLAAVATADLQRFLADGALRGQPAPRSQRRKTANLKVFYGWPMIPSVSKKTGVR